MDSDGKWRGAPAYDLTFTMNKQHQMLFDYTNGYDISKKKIEQIALKFGISDAKEILENMINLKYTLLPLLAKEYEMREWGITVVDSTKGILEK